MYIKIKNREYCITKYVLFVGLMTLVRVLLMGFFFSDYQNQVILPFITDSINNVGNIYQTFPDMKIADGFPYPNLLVLIEYFGVFIIRLFGIENMFWVSFWFKFPSLVADIICFFLLTRMCCEKNRYIAVLYYASPVILYGVYIYGQLELIPVCLLVSAMYFISSKRSESWRYLFGIIFSVAALLCKLHILIAVPIIFFYVAKRDSIKKSLAYVACSLGLVFASLFPIWPEGLIRITVLNNEWNSLTDVTVRFGTIDIYIPVIAILLVYFLALKTDFMNRELFFSLVGIIFAIAVVVSPDIPGWCIFLVPFTACFFAQHREEERRKYIIIYVLVNIWYLLYYVFLDKNTYAQIYFLKNNFSFIKCDDMKIANLVWTLMAGTLIYLVTLMYITSVSGNYLYKRKNLPFTIGIAGDSGTGKSTILGVIEKCLGKKNLLYIEGDGDHRWERQNTRWNEYTPLNPKANYLYRQAEDLRQLRAGNSVNRVEYDHSTGKFTNWQKIKSKKYVVLCGLHSLYLPQTRRYLDLKIYMDADEALRRFWKIQRDTKERGYAKDKVITSIEARMPDAEKYIYPQKQYADLIIHYFDRGLMDCMTDEYTPNICISLTLDAAVNVEPLIDELKKYGVDISYDYSTDIQKQIINFNSENIERIRLPLERISNKIFPQLEEITRENFETDIEGKDGIIMLFFLLMLSNKMRGITG